MCFYSHTSHISWIYEIVYMVGRLVLILLYSDCHTFPLTRPPQVTKEESEEMKKTIVNISDSQLLFCPQSSFQFIQHPVFACSTSFHFVFPHHHCNHLYIFLPVQTFVFMCKICHCIFFSFSDLFSAE